MMLDDLERLERVHHHRELPPEPTVLPRRRSSFTQATHDLLTHNPWASGLRTAVTDALRASIDAVANTLAEGRRRSLSFPH